MQGLLHLVLGVALLLIFICAFAVLFAIGWTLGTMCMWIEGKEASRDIKDQKRFIKR